MVWYSVELDGFATFAGEASGLSPQGADLGTMVLDLGASLDGRVVDSYGNGIAGAEFHRVPMQFSEGYVVGLPEAFAGVSDATGGFQFNREQPGPFRFLVSAGGHRRVYFDGVLSAAGAHLSGLVVLLPLGASIRGRVVNAPPGETLVVEVRKKSDSQAGGATDSLAAKGVVTVSDADRTFEFHHAEPNATYRLTLHKREVLPGGASRRCEFLDHRTGADGEVAEVSIQYQPGGAIAFTVLDADGHEARLDRVKVGHRATRKVGVDPLVGTVGTYRLDGIWPRFGLTAVTLELELEGHAKWRQEGIEVPTGGVTQLGQIHFERLGGLRVRVLDDVTREPVEKARLRVVESSNDDVMKTWEFETTDSDGAASVPVMAGARIRLRVSTTQHAPLVTDEIAVTETLLASGMELSVEPGGGARVLVVDSNGAPVPDVRIHVRGEPMEMMQAMVEDYRRTDVEGRAEVGPLAPGDYELRAGPPGEDALAIALLRGDGGDFQWTEATIVGGEETEVEIRQAAFAALSGTITASGQALRGAQVTVTPIDADTGRPTSVIPSSNPIQTLTDRRGEYALSNLAPATVEVSVTHPECSMAHVRVKELTSGDNRLDLEMSTTVVKGRVVDRTGAPVVGAAVEVEPHWPDLDKRKPTRAVVMRDLDGKYSVVRRGRESRQVMTNDEGYFELRGVVSDVALIARASHGAHGVVESDAFTVQPDSAIDEIELGFQAFATVVIDGGGISDECLVSLRRLNSSAGAKTDRRNLAGGTVEFTRLSAGRFSVFASEGRERRFSAEPSSFDLEPGATVTVKLTPQ